LKDATASRAKLLEAMAAARSSEKMAILRAGLLESSAMGWARSTVQTAVLQRTHYRPLAGQILGPLFGELTVKSSGGLANLDQVAVGVPQVATDLGAPIDWRRNEICSL
jgi:hypothetical protein